LFPVSSGGSSSRCHWSGCWCSHACGRSGVKVSVLLPRFSLSHVKLFGPRPRFKCSVSANCFARDHSPLGRLRPRYKPGAARSFPFFLALPIHGFLPTLAVLTSVPGSAPSSPSGVRLVTHGRAPIDFSRCNCGSHSPGLDFHA
jgi:hypothetical protein